MSVEWSKKGMRRLVIAASAIWLLSVYVVQKQQIDLWFSWLGANPSTTCVDVFRADEKLLTNCEYAGPGGLAEKYVEREKGKSNNFDQFYNEIGQTDIIWLWLAMPVVLFGLISLGEWVFRGFKTESRNP